MARRTPGTRSSSGGQNKAQPQIMTNPLLDRLASGGFTAVQDNQQVTDWAIYVHRHNPMVLRSVALALDTEDLETGMKNVEDLVGDVIMVEEEEKDRYLAQTQKKTDDYAEYLLLDIAQDFVAFSRALDQTVQRLDLIFDHQVTANLAVLENIVWDSVKVKMTGFLTTHMGLTQQQAETVISHRLARELGNGQQSKDRQKANPG